MIKHLLSRTFVLALVAGWLVFGSQTPQSQSAINSSTITNAITVSQLEFSVGSTTNVAAGYLAVAGTEVMRIVSVPSSGRVSVRRGQEGSTAQAHAASTTIYIAASGSFIRYIPSGTCTLVSDGPYPRPHIPSGRLFDCPNGVWAERIPGHLRLAGESTVEGRLFVREEFDRGYFVHQDDMTAKSVADTEVNVVHGSPLGLISYREEQAKTASSWVIADGKLDIAADNTTDNEGVEIVFGGNGGTTTEGVIVAGTQGACVTASITLTDITGTDQLVIGWRQNETWTDAANYAGYTVWHTVGVTSAAGAITSKAEVSSSTVTDTPGVAFADGETRLLKSCVSKAGVFSAFYSANGGSVLIPITMTNSGLTATAGIQMYPFLSFLADGTDGPNPLINWVQIEAVP